jgi:F0F1-type ATP synthase assembly protein I
VFFFILFGALIGGGFRWISDFYENKLFLFLFIVIIISLIFIFEKLMRKAFRIIF